MGFFWDLFGTLLEIFFFIFSSNCWGIIKEFWGFFWFILDIKSPHGEPEVARDRSRVPPQTRPEVPRGKTSGIPPLPKLQVPLVKRPGDSPRREPELSRDKTPGFPPWKEPEIPHRKNRNYPGTKLRESSMTGAALPPQAEPEVPRDKTPGSPRDRSPGIFSLREPELSRDKIPGFPRKRAGNPPQKTGIVAC